MVKATVTLDFSPMIARRHELHISRLTLAARTGIAYTTIWRWEKGRHVPSLPELILVARALGRPMTNLFEAKS